MTSPRPDRETTVRKVQVFRSYMTETTGFVEWAQTGRVRDIPDDCPPDERWIYENPDVIGSIRRGAGQAAQGKTTRRSFLDGPTDK